MVQIYAVHMVGGERHEHIGSVRWKNTSGATGENTRAEMVSFLEQNPKQAIVSDGQRSVTVGVVDSTPKYIRTYSDGVWTDNLLALPRY